MHLLYFTYYCLYITHRYNQELEEDSVAMEQERAQLQQQAESLAQRLQQILSDKFVPAAAFDADTPIDKTLVFLQEIIKVSMLGKCIKKVKLPICCKLRRQQSDPQGGRYPSCCHHCIAA